MRKKLDVDFEAWARETSSYSLEDETRDLLSADPTSTQRIEKPLSILIRGLYRPVDAVVCNIRTMDSQMEGSAEEKDAYVTKLLGQIKQKIEELRSVTNLETIDPKDALDAQNATYFAVLKPLNLQGDSYDQETMQQRVGYMYLSPDYLQTQQELGYAEHATQQIKTLVNEVREIIKKYSVRPKDRGSILFNKRYENAIQDRSLAYKIVKARYDEQIAEGFGLGKLKELDSDDIEREFLDDPHLEVLVKYLSDIGAEFKKILNVWSRISDVQKERWHTQSERYQNALKADEARRQMDTYRIRQEGIEKWLGLDGEQRKDYLNRIFDIAPLEMLTKAEDPDGTRWEAFRKLVREKIDGVQE